MEKRMALAETEYLWNSRCVFSMFDSVRCLHLLNNPVCVSKV